MPGSELDLNPVSHITVDALGQPGKRVFYLQAWRVSDPQPVTIIIEKIQLQTLAVGIEQFLAEVQEKVPTLPEASADYEEEIAGDKRGNIFRELVDDAIEISQYGDIP